MKLFKKKKIKRCLILFKNIKFPKYIYLKKSYVNILKRVKSKNILK